MANIADIQGKWRWFIDGERIAIVENNIDALDENMEGKYVSPQTAGSVLTCLLNTSPSPRDRG